MGASRDVPSDRMLPIRRSLCLVRCPVDRYGGCCLRQARSLGWEGGGVL